MTNCCKALEVETPHLDIVVLVLHLWVLVLVFMCKTHPINMLVDKSISCMQP